MKRTLQRRVFLRLSAAAGSLALLQACAPAPVAQAPATSAPASGVAVAPAPATQAPVTQAPVTQAPVTQAPVTQAPVTGAPVRGGTVRMGVQSAGTSDTSNRNVARAMYNSLIRADQNGNLTGELAETWQIADPQTYIFSLRKGITFHDGTEFNADAVKFNVARIQDPLTKAVSPSDWTGITSVDVIDNFTVRFRLTAPDTTLLGRLSGKAAYFASPTAVKKWGQDYALHGAGTGPFELADIQPDISLTLKRFDGYWEKDKNGQTLPYLDGLISSTVSDATTRFNALRGGQLEYDDELLPSDVAVLKNQSDLTYVEAPGPQKWMWFHCGKPPFDSKALRQAVAWSIDYDAIHKAIFAGTGSVGKYVYGPLNAYFDQSAPFYSLDPTRAKQKLVEGGQPNGFSFTAHVANVVLDQQEAQAIKAQLAQVGITMDIQVLESQAILNDRRMTGDFVTSFSQFSAYPDPNDTLYSYLRTGVPNNFPRYSNPAVDVLLDKAKSELNDDVRKTDYAQIQRMVIDDIPILPIHHDSKLTGLTKRVQGYTPTVDTWPGFVERLWLTK